MKIFAGTNQKGGVGKTSLNLHVAEQFAEKGNTLIVDLDSQGNMTSWLLNEEELPTANNVTQLFKKKNPKPLKLSDSLSLIGSDILLTEFDSKNDFTLYFILQKFLKKYENEFEYVILDTPPNLGIFTLNALLSADYLYIPVDIGRDSLKGLSVLLSNYEEIKEDHNEKIKLLGFVINNDEPNTKASKRVKAHIAENYPGMLLSVIPHTTKVRDARETGQSVFKYCPEHKVVTAFNKLFQAINKRVYE